MSIVGSSLMLVITEPTLRGRPELRRVAEFARHVGLPAIIGLNKWNTNKAVNEAIETRAANMGLKPVGRIRYYCVAMAAQVAGQNLFEYSNNHVVEETKSLWKKTESQLDLGRSTRTP